MNIKQSILIIILTLLSFNAFATALGSIKDDKASVTMNSCGIQTQAPCIFTISSKHVNRIVTPFKNPSIKLDNITGVAYKAVDNVLYLSTKTTQKIAGFITEKGDESSAIKVVLKPQDITPQEIILNGSAGGSEMARKFERSNPRDTTIHSVLSTLAKQMLPTGYQMGSVNSSYIPKCKQSGLLFNFFKGQFVSGGDYVVSIGTVKNNTGMTIDLAENSCYQDGVIAVASYPHVTLLPKQMSEVYVMYYRAKNVSSSTPPRRSLLSGGN